MESAPDDRGEGAGLEKVGLLGAYPVSRLKVHLIVINRQSLIVQECTSTQMCDYTSGRAHNA